MPRKCPPGVICIENMTLVFIFIIILIILYFSYSSLVNYITKSYLFNLINLTNLTNLTNSNNSNNSNNLMNSNHTYMGGDSSKTGLYPRPGYSFSNIENDVLLNPYEAPLRDNRVFPNNQLNNSPNRMPINVATQSVDTNYRQIGLLTRIGEKETILPLMGRPLMTNRDKWNFYTMSENNNMLKLPIAVNKSGSNSYKKCMAENGCDDLYSGDTVKVDGYNDLFKVTTYENNAPQYIPYI
jgi:hypothetical protein